MRKFGSLGLRLLKMLHILLIVLFLGGILSCFALLIKLDLSNFDEVDMAYRTFNIISDNVVKIGAQGTILLGAVYDFFTKWGFIKHKWLAVKWVLFIAQTFIGILMVDKLMVANLFLALSNPVFIHNYTLRLEVVIVQIGLTLIAMILSVLKPVRSRTVPETQALPSH